MVMGRDGNEHPVKFILMFILKDEAETIEQAIKAFHWDDGKPLYDRLIIGIDNNTKDNTEEIVRKYTDEVSFFDWGEDFSKHRNALIDKADKDAWIMFPDGHEVMRTTANNPGKYDGREVIQELLKINPTEANVFSPNIEIDVDDNDIPDVIFRRPIFFKNTGHVKFHRKVHNYLFDDDKKIICRLPEVFFIHNMPEKRKQMRTGMRTDMNVRKLGKSVSEKPKDVRDNFYYADSLDEANDVTNAIKHYKKSFKLSDQHDPDIAAQICISAMNSLYKVKKYKEMVEWGYKGLRNRWDRAELYHYLALAKKNLNKLHESNHWWYIASQLPLPDTTYFLMARVYSWYPWEGMAVNFSQLGELDEALKCFRRVLEWKTNKKTGEGCPATLHNIKLLKEAIEKRDKDKKAKDMTKEFLSPEILNNAMNTVSKGEKQYNKGMEVV